MQFNWVQLKLLVFDSNAWNYLIVCKQISSDLCKDFINKILFYKSYIF